MIKSIVTVCTGNICRSPVAEAVLRSKLPQCDVSSAGLGALVGHGADAGSQLAAQDFGITLLGHSARQFDARIGEASDLILVMDRGHLQKIRHKYPQLTGKCFLLRHYCDTPDIPDPYRMGVASHYRAVELIIEGANAWVRQIEDLS
jgi:protein-tyrosine phosphatase